MTESKPTILTFLLCALLVDAAVETFVSGAPVRWWVVGTVGAYLVLTVGIWSFGGPLRDRFGWMASAGAPVLVLLGLLALTAWMPEGLTRGVVVLGQTTSVVLSVASALAVAFAGLAFARVTFVPWWGRAAFGLLAVYGVVAFAVGIFEGIPYPDLLQGGSLWRRLPYWLQGGFIGALVAVPCAFLAGLIDTLRRLRSADRLPWGLQQNLALGLSVLMAVSGVASRSSSVSGDRPVQASSDLGSKAHQAYQAAVVALAGGMDVLRGSKEDRSRRLQTLFTNLEGAAQELPKDTFDPADIVARVGTDPRKLFEWVRDNTRFVPYRGALRGPAGVLMDRLGNSLDRALLLQALLTRANVPARLVRGVLTPEQIQPVLGALQSTLRVAVPQTPASSDNLAELARRVGLPAEEAAQQFEALIRSEKGIAEQVKQSVANQVSYLGRLLPAQVVETARVDEQVDHLIRDHWWVQFDEAGTWVNADSTLRANEAGTSLAEAREVFAGIDVPADLEHFVEVRVIAEQLKAGRLTEQPVFARTLQPRKLLGRRILLSHYAMNWPRDVRVAPEYPSRTPFAALERTALAQREWAPILQLGSESDVQSSVTADGDVNNTPFAPLLGSSAGNLGRSLGGLLGGGSIGEARGRTPKNGSHLTAEWIEYEIRSPGEPARKWRRTIFDVVGPAARQAQSIDKFELTDQHRRERALALLGETEILPLVGWLSRDFVAHLTAQNMLASRDLIMSTVGDAVIDDEALNALQRRAQPLPGRLYTLALARREWSRLGDSVYLSRPNVLAFTREPAVHGDGKLRLYEGFDIIANDVDVVRNGKDNAFLIRLEQGVLDSNAEAILAVTCGGTPDTVPVCSAAENVAASFADPSQAAWMALTNPEQVAQLTASGDIRTRVRDDLAAGYIVVAPGASAGNTKFPGWWRVDSRTGQVVGIDWRGRGGTSQAAVEWKAVIQLLAATVTAARAFMCVLQTDEYRGHTCVDANGNTWNTGQGSEVIETMVCMVGGGAAVAGGAGGIVIASTATVLSAAAAGIVLLGVLILLILDGYRFMTPPVRGVPCAAK